MADLHSPEVKLICAATFAPSIDLDIIIESLEEAFGVIDGRSQIIDFDHTDYYAEEMGGDLQKILFSFANLIKAGNIWLAKRTAIDIEMIYRKGGRRQVNLDPGYLETSKLVLASTKNFSHRIYINQGIYAEVTLQYADGKFRSLPWTYPDYLDNAFQSFLEKTRSDYKKIIRA